MNKTIQSFGGLRQITRGQLGQKLNTDIDPTTFGSSYEAHPIRRRD